jgi:hypothetical protein
MFRERWKGRKERRLGVGHPRLPHLPSPAYGFPEKPKSSYRLSVIDPREG